VPVSTGNLNDGLVALKDGKMVVLRVPYPIGFYAKGFDGRLDDPKAGWKGRGIWAATAIARRGSSKAARARGRWRRTSSSDPTRWRSDMNRDPTERHLTGV